MPKQIFGAESVVATLNRAFNDQSPSNATFNNQVAAAGTTTDSQMAFAKTFGAGYAGLTADALSTKLLGNLGVLPNAALQTALKDYITAAGVANVGIIALQLGDILSGLENATGDQAGFATAAKAWNNEVTASYNYSANPANTGPGPLGSDDQAVTGVTISLGAGLEEFISPAAAEAKYKTTANNDTIIAGANLSAGDSIDGGGGVDTLKVSVAGAADAADDDTAVNTDLAAATITNVEKIFVTATIADGGLAGKAAGATTDGATVTVKAANFTGVTELWSDTSVIPASGAQEFNALIFTGVKLATTVGVKGATAGDVQFNFASATGLTDTASLVAGGNTGAGAVIVNDIETLNVSSITAANTLTLKGSTLESLVVSGDKALTADLSNLAATLKSVDTTAATAAVTLTTGAIATAATIKTGAGADTVNLTSAAAKVTLDSGSGNDTVVLFGTKAHAVTLGAGVDTLQINKVAGTLNVSSAGTLNASAVTVSDFVSGTDKVVFTGAGAAAVKSLSGTQASEVAGSADLKAAATAAITKSGIANQYEIVSFQFGADTYVLYNTSGADSTLDATDTLVKLTGVASITAADVTATA